MGKLTSWNELAGEISGIPHEFSVAISSGRAEIAGLIRRPLSLEETRSVAEAIRVLIETNRSLQQHSAEIAVRAESIRGTFKGLARQLEALKLRAEFSEIEYDTDNET